MRTITALTRTTPVVALQEHAQLNTLHDIVHQQREAPKLKAELCDSAQPELLTQSRILYEPYLSDYFRLGSLYN